MGALWRHASPANKTSPKSEVSFVARQLSVQLAADPGTCDLVKRALGQFIRNYQIQDHACPLGTENQRWTAFGAAMAHTKWTKQGTQKVTGSIRFGQVKGSFASDMVGTNPPLKSGNLAMASLG